MDSKGTTLTKHKGSKFKSYQNVLIRKTAVNTALLSCDYVFFCAAQNTPHFMAHDGGGAGGAGGAGDGMSFLI